MTLEDMTVDQMVEAAGSLQSCLRNRSLEDAFHWLVALTYALHRHELRRLAEVRGMVDKVSSTLKRDDP